MTKRFYIVKDIDDNLIAIFYDKEYLDQFYEPEFYIDEVVI